MRLAALIVVLAFFAPVAAAACGSDADCATGNPCTYETCRRPSASCYDMPVFDILSKCYRCSVVPGTTCGGGVCDGSGSCMSHGIRGQPPTLPPPTTTAAPSGTIASTTTAPPATDPILSTTVPPSPPLATDPPTLSPATGPPAPPPPPATDPPTAPPADLCARVTCEASACIEAASCVDGACVLVSSSPGTPCSDPCLADGSECDGNGACTGTRLVCEPSDQCRAAGACQAPDGTCTDPPAPAGTPCLNHAGIYSVCDGHGSCSPLSRAVARARIVQ